MTVKQRLRFFLRVAGMLLPASIGFVVPSAGLHAQNPVRFEATAEPREVVEGSIFEVTFSLKNAQGSRFVTPDFKGFKIAGGPSEMRGMSIVNGQTASHQSWVYQLEAPRTGTFTIGPASVTANGKVLNTNPLTIQVVASRTGKGGTAAVPPGGDDQIFISGELDRETVYPGEQVTWRIKLYTQLSVEGADLIDLPKFEGFFSKEKRRFDTRVQYQTVRGKKYAVKTLHEEALFPQNVGEFTIGTASVRAAVESAGGGLGMLLGAKPVLLQTQPIRLKVKALPTPAPTAFTGGVGQYEWTVAADKNTLTTDDALTITMTVEGNGDANRLAPPVLHGTDSLEIFEPKVNSEEQYENTEQMIHSKVLEYVVLPKHPGFYSIQPTFAYFDPDSNRYLLRTAQKIDFQVTAGKNYQPAASGQDSVSAPVIIPETSSTTSWLESPVLWWCVSGLLLLTLVLLFLKRKRPEPAYIQVAPVQVTSYTATPPPAPAKSSRDRFVTIPYLLKNGQPRVFYDTLLKALQAYLSEKIHLPPAQMNRENVQRRLLEYQMPPARIQTILDIWDTCEQSVYAGQDQTAQMETTWRATEGVLREMER